MHEVTKGQFAAFVNAKNYQTAAERDGRGGYGLNAEGKYEQKPEPAVQQQFVSSKSLGHLVLPSLIGGYVYVFRVAPLPELDLVH